jgi:hypothetical protein
MMEDTTKDVLSRILLKYENKFPAWKLEQERSRHNISTSNFYNGAIQPFFEDVCTVIKAYGHEASISFDDTLPVISLKIIRYPRHQ